MQSGPAASRPLARPIVPLIASDAGTDAAIPGVATGRIRFVGQRGALIAPPGGILIASGNERGNIEKAILRMPRFGRAQEILFVGGYSADFEECERVATATRVLS